MNKKKLNKTVWYSSELDENKNPILPPIADSPTDLNGLHEGEIFLHNSDEDPSIWIRTSSGKIQRLKGTGENVSFWELMTDENGNKYIFTKYHLVTQLGLTMYSGEDGLNLPSIYDGLPIDSQTIYWEDIKDGNGVVIGKILKAKTGGGTLGSLTNVGEWADSIADVDRIMVQKKGSDTWEAMDVSGIGSASFENISESGEGNAYTSFELSEDKKFLTLVKGETFALASDLEDKWTTDEELINNWNTAFSWGDHSKAGYAAKSYVDSTFITIAGNEDVTGVHNFVNGLKIGGKLIDKPKDDVIYIDANLVVRGGITMYGDRDANIPSILNSIPTAGYDDIQARGLIAFNSKHFVINNGVVSAIQGSAGLNEEQLGNYLKNNHYATEDWVKEYIVEINTGETVNITKQMVLDALEYIPYDASNPNGYITSATLDGYLPLSGGVIDGWVRIQNNKVGDGTLYIKGISTKPIIRFEGDVSWGYLGFGSANNPCYYDNSLREYSLIHSGNIGSQSVNYATSSGSCTGNAASATKLSDNTSFTIWGQTFFTNGKPQSVSGDLSGVGNVISSGAFIGRNSSKANESYFGNASSGVNGDGALMYAYGGRNLYFYTNGVERIRVTSSGNVGIGTTGPAYKLDVVGVSRSTYMWFWNTSFSGNAGYIGRGSVANNSIYLHSVDSLRFGTGGIDDKMILDTAGNLLVTGGITMYSARILKNIVDERGLSLKELSVIKPTRYTWKDGRDSNIHIGGIADDIQQVLPEVVYKTEEGVLTMDYGNAGFAIAASLIKPVVDHEQRIKALERENEMLKQELNRLRA